jgi:phosphonoacetate hydrolase
MTNPISRRDLLKYGAAAGASAAFADLAFAKPPATTQRTVVVMFDGFGPAYFAESKMPVFEQWKRSGIYKQVTGMMPSVTNINNASICCGVYPETHGITGNTYFDEARGVEDYTESASLLLISAPFGFRCRRGKANCS